MSYWKFLKHPVELVQSLWDKSEPVIGAIEPTKEAAAQAAAANTSLTPHGICGWIPNDSGMPTWACQALGQVMPGIVFVVSVLLLIFTLSFLVRYFVRSRQALRTLKDVLRQLEAMPPTSARDWPAKETTLQVLATLDRVTPRFPPVGPLRRKVAGCLVHVDDAQTKVAMSHALESETAELNFQRWTGERLADQLPSWLTSIGLLTTFLAILLGLQGVRVLANMEVQGIGGLVNGLSGKFFSSIVALGCAVTVTIANYFWSESLNSSWTSLVTRVQSLIPAITVERAFLDLLRERKQKVQP